MLLQNNASQCVIKNITILIILNTLRGFLYNIFDANNIVGMLMLKY